MNIIITALIVVICLALIGVPACYYAKHIGTTITGKSDTWGQFGDFFGPFINAVNTAAVLYLSYIVYRVQHKKDAWERRLSEPQLKFVAVDGKYYRLYNMGGSTANNIIVAKIPTGKTEIAIPPYHCYDLAPGFYAEIHWSAGSEVLYAYYKNLLDKEFLVRCQKDINREITGRKIVLLLTTMADRKDDVPIHAA